ncbi:hypothetical protein NHJ13734_009853 [Beauveria thailandica]
MSCVAYTKRVARADPRQVMHKTKSLTSELADESGQNGPTDVLSQVAFGLVDMLNVAEDQYNVLLPDLRPDALLKMVQFFSTNFSSTTHAPWLGARSTFPSLSGEWSHATCLRRRLQAILVLRLTRSAKQYAGGSLKQAPGASTERPVPGLTPGALMLDDPVSFVLIATYLIALPCLMQLIPVANIFPVLRTVQLSTDPTPVTATYDYDKILAMTHQPPAGQSSQQRDTSPGTFVNSQTSMLTGSQIPDVVKGLEGVVDENWHRFRPCKFAQTPEAAAALTEFVANQIVACALVYQQKRKSTGPHWWGALHEDFEHWGIEQWALVNPDLIRNLRDEMEDSRIPIIKKRGWRTHRMVHATVSHPWYPDLSQAAGTLPITRQTSARAAILTTKSGQLIKEVGPCLLASR